MQRKMIQTAREAGLLVFKIRFIGRRGCPDLLLIFPSGRVIFVEVKIPGGRLSMAQKLMLKLLRRFGVPAYDCDNMEEFKQILETHKNETEL